MQYAIFGMAARSAVENGGTLPVGGRTRWQVELDVARLSGGGTPSVTVVLEVSPTGEDGSWQTVVTLGPITTVGTTVKRSWIANDFTAQVTARDIYLRGRVSAIVGTVTCALRASTAWLDPEVPADAALLSQELRSYPDVERVCQQAEADVFRLLTRVTRRDTHPNPGYPEPGALADDNLTPAAQTAGERWAGWPTGLVLDAEFTSPSMQVAVQREVARQAEWVFRREMLSRRVTDPASVSEARRMGALAPGLAEGLSPYRPLHRSTYRGRG